MSSNPSMAALTALTLAFAAAAQSGWAQSIQGNPAATVIPKITIAGPDYRPPRTAWGAPNLQGLWTNATLTTLERPQEFGDRLVMSSDELKKIENDDAAEVASSQKATDPNAKVTDLPVNCGRGFSGVNCGYNNFWVDPGKTVMRVNGEPRTSFLVEPKNGKLPGLTPDYQKARQAQMAALPRGPGLSRGDNPESMTLAERCIKDFGSSSGPPMMPLLYNNTYQIIQTPSDVMILTEMVHDARIVRLSAERQHTRPAAIAQWMGDAIGWYEGDVLVVETTNFRPGQAFRGAPTDLKLIERFRRINNTQILYSFEINDAKVFTAPIKAEIAFNATPGPLYEYACHEGNYALPHILAGNRKADAETAASARKAAATPAPAAAEAKSGASAQP